MEDKNDDERYASFTSAEEIEFIELVSKYPYLYDNRHPTYRDLGEKEIAWKEIGKKMDLPYRLCKSRWRSIRDTYKRAKKRSRGKTILHPSSKLDFYSKLLTFLDELPQESDKNTNNDQHEYDVHIENIKVESETEDSSIDEARPNEASSSTKHGIKRQRTEFEVPSARLNANDSEIDSFATYIRDVFKKLPRRLQIQAKQELFQVLTKYEIQSLAAQENDPLFDAR